MNTRSVYAVNDTNKVLKNTYGLLAITTAFSALMAYMNMFLMITITPIVTLALYIGLIFITHKMKDSGWGIACVFAITGLLGFTIGPIIQSYMANIPNGSALVAQAFLGTAITFVGVNMYVAKAKPKLNESWLPIMFWTMAVAVVVSLVNYYFLQMSILSVVISAVILLISVVYLVYQTNAIINGGETNYVLATVGIFVSLYNIFMSLLSILGFVNKD